MSGQKPIKSLFVVESSAQHLMPKSFDNAAVLASRIIRSEFHKLKLCSLFQVTQDDEEYEDHISMNDLTELVNKDDVFVVDKIRHLSYLDARACVLPDYDHSKVYLNPIMLVEMQDREREAEEMTDIEKNGLVWEDLYGSLPVNLLDSSGKPIRKRHNSLVYAKQKLNASASLSPPMKKSKPSLIPSRLSILEKDTLMLTLMLVHEADHLLNGLLSKEVKIKKLTPTKRKSAEHDKDFTDIGHMMEREMYGYVIQHGFDDALPSPFAIHEVLGSKHMLSSYDKNILDISPALKQLLSFPEADVEINEEVLKMKITSSTPFQQHANPCILALRSTHASDTGEGSSTPVYEAEDQKNNDPMSRGRR